MIKSNENEKKLGLEVFFTDTPGMGGKIKIVAEDFIVEEISLEPERKENGNFTIARIKSKNWETNKLVRELSRALGISRKRICFAGTKDKRAVTTQLFCFQASKEIISKLSLPDVEILDLYTSAKPVEIGNLIGNEFEVLIRNIALPAEKVKTIVENVNEIILAAGGFPNFYGVQRFGAVRPITHIVGKYILEGNFEKALLTYTAEPIKGEHPEAFEARKFLKESYDFKKALSVYPKELIFERAIIHYLAKESTDYIGALRQLPKNLLMMFIHSYQSYLFNRILSERLRRNYPLGEALIGDLVLTVDKYNLPCHNSWVKAEERNIPKLNARIKEGKAFVSGVIFGAESEFAEGVQGEIESKIIAEEKIKREDFIIPAMPELSSKGERRNLIAPLKALDYKINEDSLHSAIQNSTLRAPLKQLRLQSILLKFQLQKGCYATSLLREFMKGSALTDY